MDLLKLLIADDEENIRNGLKCILDWVSIGYKFCGEASNGKDAVNQIIDLKPDLVILDIKMPGMTGVEVISQVKTYFEKHNLDFPTFIILSGYSEFEYAQKTVNLGAKAYLLKPVDEDELQDVVTKIAEEIRQKRILTQSFKNSEFLVLKEKLLSMIQNSIYDETELSQIAFFSDAENSTYQAAVFYTDRCINAITSEIQKTMENYFSFFTNIFIKNENKLLLFIKTKNEQAVKNCLERASKLFKAPTFITLGNAYSGYEGIIKSYKDAISYEKYLFLFSDLPFISKAEIDANSNFTKDTDLEHIIGDIIFCIETYNKDKLYECEKLLHSTFYKLENNEEEIKKLIIYCLVELHNKLTSKYPEREISDGSTFDIVPKILGMKTYEESFNYLKLILNNYIENFNFNTSDSIIIKVIAYIKSHFDEDLKLETLGDMFNCNSAYLGKKFKKYTGTQFNTYLDNLRIEEAKNKIKNTDLKIYQISKLVGYTNTDYFFMKFKKNTGYTPKEYKKVLDESSEE